MIRPRPTAALLGLALAACGERPLPDPKILSIAPQAMMASESLTASVVVEAVLPFAVSYGDLSATANPEASLYLGEVRVGTGRYEPGGDLLAFIPSIFPVGAYDVSVVLGDGRTARMPQGFIVTAGAWPGWYSIDDLSDQRLGQPFSVTIRAHGGGANGFHGTVRYEGVSGAILPLASGSFEDGVRTEMMTASETGRMQIQVVDQNGGTGLSASFTVR